MIVHMHCAATFRSYSSTFTDNESVRFRGVRRFTRNTRGMRDERNGMELRQLRYFLKIVELGSMGRAAQQLGVVTSALSQQISRLESELSTRLLQRTSSGVVPTDAGLAFWRQAQLAIRHAEDAVRAAQLARLSGHVSVGMAPSTIAVLGLPFMGLRPRYAQSAIISLPVMLNPLNCASLI